MFGPKPWDSLELRWQTVMGGMMGRRYLKYKYNGNTTKSKSTQEYKYLDGRCRHYKLIGDSGLFYKNFQLCKLLLF